MQTTESEKTVTSRSGPGGVEIIQRIAVLIFGLIQLVIGARIVLLLLDARTANGLVSNILNISQAFVAPFNGILQTDAIKSSGAVLDTAAILALVGWTVLEIVVFWGLNIFNRDRPASA
jgi:hypothetical protein